MGDQVLTAEALRVRRMIEHVTIGRAALESLIPTCGRKGCGRLSGHGSAEDLWEQMLARVADEVAAMILCRTGPDDPEDDDDTHTEHHRAEKSTTA